MTGQRGIRVSDDTLDSSRYNNKPMLVRGNLNILLTIWCVACDTGDPFSTRGAPLVQSKSWLPLQILQVLNLTGFVYCRAATDTPRSGRKVNAVDMCPGSVHRAVLRPHSCCYVVTCCHLFTYRRGLCTSALVGAYLGDVCRSARALHV